MGDVMQRAICRLHLGVAIALMLWASASAKAAAERLSPADQLMRSGAENFHRGDFAAAARDWKQAEATYRAGGDADGGLDAQLNLAAVDQQLGNFKEAKQRLIALEKTGSGERLVAVKSALGVAFTFTRGPLEAEKKLTEATELATAQNAPPATLAGIKNNLGNLYASWAEILGDKDRSAKYAAAFDAYTAAADLARSAGDNALAAKATTNAALSAARGEHFDKARELIAKSADAIRDLPDSAEKANLLISLGQANALLIRSNAPGTDVARLRRDAFNAYEQARQIAKAINNSLAGSYAVGYQGHLYEMAGKDRLNEALTLTRRAVLLAETARSGDSLFLWKWQAGRILKAQGMLEDATAAYLGARDTLQNVRSDQALGYGNRGMGWNFRKEVGPLYYELADLLLARADTAGADEAHVQQYLAEARDTVERLRVGEFESYFEDPCRNQAAARQTDLTKDLANVPSGNPAVVYLIPLRDRIEILLTTKTGMRQIKSPGVGTEQLTQQIRTFRRQLEDVSSQEFYETGQKLYEWLIKPIEPTLQAEKIDTLVFVPDGALRTIPMSALYDGQDFLAAKYAVAVSPGLSLSVGGNYPAEVSKSARRVLASGLSEAKRGFNELPSVVGEIDRIRQIYAGEATTLLNEQFKAGAFEQELSRPAPGDEGYSIVHIASHGVFSADVAKTFILTYDGTINLDDLASLLQPYQLRNKPIDLLTLSACQTSAGDDQAAMERASLGLGGLAVKAGARSAMASLWLVNDQATQQLVTAFYEELAQHPEAGKAKALQQAQLKLIRGDNFTHPLFWAPFLLIGDWL
jgi:CHAT domain-containing protein